MAVAFQSIFAIFYLYRNMPANNAAYCGVQPEITQNSLHGLFVFEQGIVGVFVLFTNSFIFNEIQLKGCHFAFSEQGGVFA